MHALAAMLAAARRAQGALLPVLWTQGPGRAGAPLALLLIAAAIGLPLTPGVCLILHTAGSALCLLPLLPGLPRPRQGEAGRPAQARGLWRAQAGWLVFSQLDLLLAGMVLAPAEAALYLVARRVAGLASLVFDALRLLHAPAISRGFGDGAGRCPAEACNRHFLFFGSATLAVILAAGPVLPLAFGPALAAAALPLAWLTAAQAAPALFGATGMTLTMAGMEGTRFRLALATLTPAALAMLAGGAGAGAVGLAAATAAAQLGHGAFAAAVLFRRHRIRPGLGLIGWARAS